MSAMGIVTTKRIMLIAPWLLLAFGLTLGAMPRRLQRHVLVASLAIIAVAGWYGIVSRRYYAAPRWLEPYKEVAQEAAETLRGGNTVVGNNGVFLFYLKWVCHIRDAHDDSTPLGPVPDSAPFPHLFIPAEWVAAEHPLQPTILFIRGIQFGSPSAPTRDAQAWLEGHCRLAEARRMVYDPGSGLKQRFFPELDQQPWRIQVLRFACPA
jgi:hypothetical protein